VLSDVLLEELSSLLELRDLLAADLAQHGTSTRRGDERGQVGQRLRVCQQVARLKTQIHFTLERPPREPRLSELVTLDPDEAWQERYDELRSTAFDERSDVSCAAQIDAIKTLQALPASSKPNDGSPPDHDRAIQALHRITVGQRIDARAADRTAAVKLLARLDPRLLNPIRQEIAEMTDEELDGWRLDFKTWLKDFAVDNPELAREVDPDVFRPDYLSMPIEDSSELVSRPDERTDPTLAASPRT
jgi:hypothetical protein